MIPNPIFVSIEVALLFIAIAAIIGGYITTSRPQAAEEVQERRRREKIIALLILPCSILLLAWCVFDSINTLQHPFPSSNLYIFIPVTVGILALLLLIARITEILTKRNLLAPFLHDITKEGK
ncbi:hypothetical protein [Dictyobacter arantiisoli]|uniref:hypothetical protein n=1 Tax=Dictyobacter arantiisoli TaxID=2014874 RepID=UPI0011EDD9D4|nr:hypothetical protein [Dictyobacter arantiisoli]